jgi:hypothetical protein
VATAPGAQPLRLLRLDETDIGPDDTVVKPSSPGLLGIAVLSLVFAGIVGWDAARGGLGWIWAGPLILALCGMAWMLYRGWRRFQRSGVWLLAVGPERVLIRFRSVVSEHLPSTLPQVIELPLSRVESIRVTRRKVEERNGNTPRRYSHHYLDFRLRDTDPGPLRDQLVQDQRERGRRWFAQRDPTVALTAEGILRVEMSYNGAASRPDVRAVAQLLAPRVRVEAEATERLDLTRRVPLSPAEQDATLRAVGETSAGGALSLAMRYFPDASREDAAAYVEHLLTARDPQTQPSAALPTDGTLPAPRLLARADARPDPGDVLVRPRAGSYLVGGVLFLALAGWLGLLGYEGRMRWWLALLLGVVSLLIAWSSLETWSKTLRRDNWVMAVGSTRVLIRFRSWMNAGLPAADPQAVELPVAHLVSARLTRQKRTRPAIKGRGASHRELTYLDLRTRGLDLAPLWNALVRERTPPHAGTRRDHDPVQLPGDDVVRVELVSTHARTRPAAAEVLRLLGRHVPVEDDASEEVIEDAGVPALSLPEHEAAIRALARSGQMMAAIRLARGVYGEGLMQARARVERLVGPSTTEVDGSS